MVSSSGQVKVYIILIILINLYPFPICNGHGDEEIEKISGRRYHHRFRRTHARRSAYINSGRSEEKKQRYCLNRLLKALETVCTAESGNGPAFFSPDTKTNQIAPVKTINSSDLLDGHSPRWRNARKFRNDIPAIPHQQQNARPNLRRRYRRNIVRECCEKPCSPTDLSKYCSPSNKFHSSKTEAIPVTKQIIALGRTIPGKAFPSRNSKVGRSPTLSKCSPGTTNCAYLRDATISGGGKTDNAKASMPSPLQCIPVSDLKLYFRKLYLEVNTKQDAVGLSTTNENKLLTKTLTDFNVENILETTTAVSNDIMPKTPEFSQIATTTPTILEKSEEDEDMMETTKRNSFPYRSSNVITAKPITAFIKFPLGQIDYVY